MTIFHKPWNTIKQLLISLNDKLDKMCRCGPVYEITFGDSDHSYIGETGRVLKVLFKEHARLTPFDPYGRIW